jgi:hypothetical protein
VGAVLARHREGDGGRGYAAARGQGELAKRIDPLLVRAAQAYCQWTKACEAGDQRAALEFFDAFDGVQHLVREQMAAEHGWTRPYTIGQKAWADRQIFEVAILALVRVRLHGEPEDHSCCEPGPRQPHQPAVPARACPWSSSGKRRT